MFVLALASALRVVGLNQLGFNSDEAVYAGQAAAIAEAPVLKDIFPIFRAHPLLFHFLLAIQYRFGVTDVGGRLLSVAIGLANVYLVYAVGKLLYGRKAGLVAALFLALMPYHVVVTRQVLLDGPMTFFATVSLYLLARFALTRRAAWLYAAGAAMGLTFLAKETGIVLMGSIYAFLALSPEVRVRIPHLVGASAAMFLVIAPFPLTLMLAGGGGSRSAGQYLVWQLFRQPNHEWSFYLTAVPPALGPLLLLAAVAGLWLLRRDGTWREKLLLSWIVVPYFFFQLWPTKGFQYLLPVAPAFVLLAARTVARWTPLRGRVTAGGVQDSWFAPLAAALVAVSLLVPSWQQIQLKTSDSFLAGSGGVPGGREAGEWVRENVPEGAQLMTLGPSMANILQFYGHRRAYGLSVSPNPLHRNPSYTPIRNPDLQLRSGSLQYIVWDSFSAARSEFFSEKLLAYAARYNGRVVHAETVSVATPGGETTVKPVIIIYEVRP